MRIVDSAIANELLDIICGAIGDSPLARGMGEYAEVFSLLSIIQLSVGAMFLLLVAPLLTVANLTVMLR